ncbi:MAG: hypothetical protein KOO62_00895 [candidate division Zixibacteria bacterium]|nr:hypothetical protein [candidate division Zixibacteria bacterium]
MSFGKTEYVMEMNFEDGSDNLHLKSQLEFPLDCMMAGGTAGFKNKSASGRPFWVEIGAYTNIGDPGGKMLDHDWWNLRTYVIEKFSYTESNVEMKSLLLTLEGGISVATLGTSTDLAIVGGIWYHRIEQDVIGFDGWQLDWDTGEQFKIALLDTIVGFYQVTYKLPHVGLQLELTPSPALTVQGKTAFTLVFASDFDDHMLRGKTAVSSITGKGFISELDVRFNPGGSNRHKWFVEANCDFVYLTSSGTQVQEWYKDEIQIDPDTGEEIVIVEKGKRFLGIPHDINATQFRLGLSVGIRF